MQHSDFSVFCNAVYLEGGEFVHGDFNHEFKLPCGLSGVVDVPTLKVYETVDVHFETEPSLEMLKALRFPQ
jgi:hypothetical protein